ncbi:hypothetical protein Thal_1393 [Thermocrinis albus DSM 14484]|uniref:Uncharacterized protein n=1 Tax=Thermocrinis albus (strain DSM 14484 / JCM 11386 / HI 11/12) TaxID=638303 RepID=D3SMP3_THEAH|nr:hypothetical protein [Thermocrinis albus]ADC90023.1 hypothetical protein Thal_1393 [Thermocrinis albus DSM 14484]
MSCNNTNETPIMVLKYRPFGRFSFFLWFLFMCGLFYYGIILTPEDAAKVKANYYFLKYGSIIFGGIGMIYFLNIINIKQIEVYTSKIIKRPIIPLPIIGQQVCIELREAYYVKVYFGIFLTPTPSYLKTLFYPLIFIPYTRLTNKNEFIEFLSKVSGKSPDEFRYLPTYGNGVRKKLIKEKTYTKEG